MTILYRFIYFTLSFLISLVHSQNANEVTATSSSKIGSSPCYINGNYNMFCKFDTVLCDQLPQECSSYIFTGLFVSLSYNVEDRFGAENDAYFLKLLQCTEKPVYIQYSYSSFMKWSVVLGCCGAGGMNVRDEAKELMVYLNKHPKITGLLLMRLDIVPGAPSYQDFSENLKCYVETLKQNLPGMEIGISVFTDYLQKYYDNGAVQPWLDFNVLDGVFDFIVADFTFANPECNRDFKHTGMDPITGNYEYTMEKTLCYLNAACFPKDKLILRIQLGPLLSESDDFLMCDVNSKQMCKKPEKAKKWCSPNLATLYAKGKFTKENAMGFAASFVDLDDAKHECQCGRPFPGFYALLAGFNGETCPSPCTLYDGC